MSNLGIHALTIINSLVSNGRRSYLNIQSIHMIFITSDKEEKFKVIWTWTNQQQHKKCDFIFFFLAVMEPVNFEQPGTTKFENHNHLPVVTVMALIIQSRHWFPPRPQHAVPPKISRRERLLLLLADHIPQGVPLVGDVHHAP